MKAKELKKRKVLKECFWCGSLMLFLIIGISIFISLNIHREEKLVELGEMSANTPSDNIIKTYNISASDSDNVTATLYEDGRFVIDGFGEMKYYDKENPAETLLYNKRPYYSNLDKIENVIIQGNVKNISHSAFSKCINLKNLTIQSNLDYIGSLAFLGCNNLDQINFQGKIKTINGFAFGGCESLKEIKLDNVTNIHTFAFDGCKSLTELYISSSVTNIGGAFSACYNLNKIEVNADNDVYDSRNNCNAIIETKTNSLIQACLSTEIPNDVTSIGECAFNGCNIESIKIPNNVTEIKYGAFSFCRELESIIIPDSVTNIEEEAFRGCSKIKEVNIPSNVTMESIGARMFQGCKNLIKVNIPNSITSIETQAFSGCTKLEKIEILGNVTSIDDSAFDNCDLLWIYGESGSKAQEFAKKHRITFCVIVVDESAPIISNVTCNPSTWTNQNVTITIDAIDNESGIASTNGYSFDNGEHWQTENTKTYSENIKNIIIKVRDNKGNIATYNNTINIENIDKIVPTVTVLTDKEEYYEGETANITTIFSEDVEDGTPKISMNGVSILKTTEMTKVNSKKYTYSYTVPKGSGIQTITISEASDLAGNLMNDNKMKKINIKSKILSSIEITTAPNKITYIEGENFDTTGMKVTATYNNFTNKEITNHTIIDGKNLKFGQTSVTISYTENGVTKTVNQAITVKKKEIIENNTVKEENTTIEDNTVKEENTTIEENTVREENTIKEENITIEENTVKEENTIKEENITIEENTITNKNTIGENTLDTNDKNIVDANNKEKEDKDTTQADKKIPQTGEINVVTIVGCIAIIVFGVSFVYWKKYKDIYNK